MNEDSIPPTGQSTRASIAEQQAAARGLLSDKEVAYALRVLCESNWTAPTRRDYTGRIRAHIAALTARHAAEVARLAEHAYRQLWAFGEAAEEDRADALAAKDAEIARLTGAATLPADAVLEWRHLTATGKLGRFAFRSRSGADITGTTVVAVVPASRITPEVTG